MSEPAGPTGVITLKKIADMTYEQYGAIVLSTTGPTQVTMSSDVADQLFRSNIEDQMTWIEEFASRIQGEPHQSSQSSFQNTQQAAWQGGAWATQGVTRAALVPQATLSGAVRQFLQAGGAALPQAELATNETQGLQQITSHIDRNPTFYIRWAHAGGFAGGLRAIGWHRRGESFTQSTGPLGGIYFQWSTASDIEGVCITHAGTTKFMTTLSMGVTAATGSYHTGRMVVKNSLASGLIMGEYVGNGLSPRTFAVTSYTPICVWVMGKNAAGNEVGAFRITGMPAGESHPWESNPATGGASRLNRITAFTPSGFTVDSSLNVTGDNYFYLCIPSVSGFSAAGSYTGNGWSREGAVVIVTTVGNFAASGGQFLAADVGQVMIRVSDGAVIGTIAAVTNSTHATGTVNIVGTFGSGAWRWQPRQIPIGFVPDLAMLCSTSQLAVGDATPVQFAPGRGISEEVGPTGTTQNFMGAGLSPANALIATNSATLEVRNDDTSATAGFNGAGKDYFWFACRSGSPLIRFETIDYTGDGAASRTISGASFTPGLWFGAGKNDTPKWKAANSAVTTGTADYAFQDGTALVADNISFGAGSVTLGNGDLNVAGRLYRAWVATDSGGARGPSVEFFMDGVSKGFITTNIPDENSGQELVPGFGSTNANDPDGIMDVDYMALAQQRTPS
jgi:hypothetical protein